MKRNGMKSGLVLVAAFLTAGCARTVPPDAPPAAKHAETRLNREAVTSPDCVVRLNVPYAGTSDPLQTLDIYSPPDAKDAPVIVYVHRGEWSKGDKSEVSFKPKFLNENGMVLVSANYRLSPAAQHPAQVNDVAQGVAWTIAHAAEFGGDGRKVILLGHSAGCHLVTLAALDPRPLALVGLKPSDLRGVVSWSGGAFDLPEKVREGGMYAQYIRATFGAGESEWRDASPMAHAGDFKPLPPFLFVSAEKDSAASIAASEKMVKLVTAAGGKADRLLLPGKTHGTADHDLGAPEDETGAALLEFIRKVTQ
jgi:arylformamidase